MVKKFLKKESKRLSCRKKYKIERKVREHNRKVRKDKKNHPEKYRNKSDPGIPNSLPFKDEIIKEADAIKLVQEEAKQKRREDAIQRRKEQRESLLDKKRNIGGNINELVATAEKRGAEFEERQKDKNVSESLGDNSAKSYYKEFKKVVEAADVILEVLDARDPVGTRCPQMENAIVSQPGKRLVLVLNKADLVPRANLEKWLKYLRREYPTIVFKSSTQTQNNNLSRCNVSALKSHAMNSSRCVGAEVLIQLLKNYCRNKGLKTAIAVGVVGLPNVGKSSLINSLKRSKACGVGATPGFTKTMQEIYIDSKIRLLDSPGIVLPGGDLTDTVAALRNAVKIENLSDPVKPVEAIYNKCSKSQLTLHYRLPEFKDFQEFLVVLAKRLGKLKKGGISDIDQTARSVLYDWNVGRIKYYTEPPTTDESITTAEIVTELAKEFSLDSLSMTESSTMDNLPLVRPSETMCVETIGPVDEIKEMDEDAEEKMEASEEEDDDDDIDDASDENKSTTVISDDVQIDMKEEEQKKEEAVPEKADRQALVFDPKKMTMKKYQKLVAKKNRKEKNRNVVRTDSLMNAFESFGGIKDKEEAYNFNDFFNSK